LRKERDKRDMRGYEEEKIGLLRSKGGTLKRGKEARKEKRCRGHRTFYLWLPPKRAAS
jgi:hypothetical protein